MGVLQIADCAAAKEKGRSGEVALRLSVGFEWQQGTAAPDDTAQLLRSLESLKLREETTLTIVDDRERRQLQRELREQIRVLREELRSRGVAVP